MRPSLLSRLPWLLLAVLAVGLLASACSGAAPAPSASAPTAAPTAAAKAAAPQPAATTAPAQPAATSAPALPAQPAAPAQKVTIKFRTPPWASTQASQVERQVAFRAVLDAFNQQYASKGCQVEEVVADDNSVNITNDVQAKKADAYWFNNSEYLPRAKAGQLLDLTAAVGDDLKSFFPWVQSYLKSSQDGKIYALWHNTDTPLFYYNTDKIPTPPKTWNELRALADKVRKDEGADKYAVSVPYVGWRQLNSGMLVAAGGKWVDEKGAPVVFQEPNRAILKSMFQYWVDLYQAKGVPSSAIANDNVKQMPDVFAGKVYSFEGNSNFHVRQLQPNLPAAEYKKWSAAPLPYPDQAGKGGYEAGGWMIGAVPTGDKAKEACAAMWVIHATGDQAQANTNKAGVWVPTRPAILEKDPFFKSDPFYQTTLKALDQGGYVLPPSAIWAALSTALDTALQRAAKGEISVDDAIKQAEAETMKEWDAVKNK